MWFVRRRVRTESLPEEKVVVRFEFRGDEKRSAWLEENQSFWLLLEKPEVELCLTDPGFEIGLNVEAELAAMVRVYLGQMSLTEALRTGVVELSGRRDLRSGFRNWLGITPFAPARPVGRRLAVAT
jgi:hypothetical protein